jgi:hypothetical protein
MKKKELWTIIGLALVLLVLYGFLSSPLTTRTLDILSVSKISLVERGVGGPGQELKGGRWRVLATSSEAVTQYLVLNQTVMKDYAGTDFPPDVAVLGGIYVRVSQVQNPYFAIPLKYLGEVEVLPKTYATHITGVIAYPEKYTAVSVEPVKVSLWELDLSQKKVIIPFKVQAIKSSGENSSFLVTDHPKAVKQGMFYSFELSYSDIISGQYSENIKFYNPLNQQEWITITLQWAFGDWDRYQWNTNYVFVADVSGGSISPLNMFRREDYTKIQSMLDWRQQDDWSFMHYWFGGGNLFKGTTVYGLFDQAYSRPFLVWEDKTPMAWVEGWEGSTYAKGLVCEGYASGSSKAHDLYEYSGWYTPSSSNEVNYSPIPSDWYNYRFPTSPNIYSDREELLPRGLSIVNYLGSEVEAPVTKAKKSALQRINPDIWGNGYSGEIPEGYKVFMPLNARQWLFTMDISTEICDTVVVEQNYVYVKLVKPLSISGQTVPANGEVTVTAEVKNFANYAGRATLGIVPPQNLVYSTTVYGGGETYFEANETKTVIFRVLNTGLLTQKTGGTFTFQILNTHGDVTDNATFVLEFAAGLGVSTSIKFTVVDVEGDKPISGALVAVEWGLNFENRQTASTTAGYAEIGLGPYEGPVKVSVSKEEYYSQTDAFTVSFGTNSKTFRLVKKGTTPPFDWTWIILIVVIVALAASLALVVTRKKKRES